VLKKTVSNLVTIASSDVLTRGTFLLFNIMVARKLTLEDFGIYGLSISLAFWLWALADGGYTTHSIKTVSQTSSVQWPQIVGETVMSRGILSLVTMAGLSLVLMVIRIPVYEIEVYCVTGLYAIAFSLFPGWLMRGVQDNKGYFWVYGIVSVAMGCALAAFLLLSPTLQNALAASFWRSAAWIVGAAVGLRFTLSRLKIRIHRKDLRMNWPMLRSTYPLGVAAILYALIPIVSLAALRSTGVSPELAQYSAAWQIQQVFIVGAGVFSASLIPMLVRALNEREGQLRRILRLHFGLLFAVAGGLSFLLWLGGPLLISVAFGERYAAATEGIGIFSIVLFIVFVRRSLDSVLIAIGKYRTMSLTGIAALFLSVAALAMISVHDVKSAAWVYLAGEGGLLVLNAGAAVVGFPTLRRACVFNGPGAPYKA